MERALVQKLQYLHGFDSLDRHTEVPEDLNDGSGPTSKRDVMLVGGGRSQVSVPCKGTFLFLFRFAIFIKLAIQVFPSPSLQPAGNPFQRHGRFPTQSGRQPQL